MIDRIFGPLFVLELIRLSRGLWLLRLRSYMALGLSFALLNVFTAWTISYHLSPWDTFTGSVHLTLWERSTLAMYIVATLLIGQLAVLLIMTPIFLAGVFPSLRHGGLLELLLTTPLTDREIAAYQAGPPIALLSSVALTVLPVCLGMLAWGGSGAFAR